MRRFGERLLICYQGFEENGTVFDERSYDNPLEVALGMTALPSGIEKALREMKDGEERTLTLEPEEAFGPYNPADVIEFPPGSIEGSQKLAPGDIIKMFGNKAGMPPAFPKVLSNDGYAIKLDFNHPMAGKTVTYQIKLVGKAS